VVVATAYFELLIMLTRPIDGCQTLNRNKTRSERSSNDELKHLRVYLVFYYFRLAYLLFTRYLLT
jgi:hypothetical protein